MRAMAVRYHGALQKGWYRLVTFKDTLWAKEWRPACSLRPHCIHIFSLSFPFSQPLAVPRERHCRSSKIGWCSASCKPRDSHSWSCVLHVFDCEADLLLRPLLFPTLTLLVDLGFFSWPVFGILFQNIHIQVKLFLTSIIRIHLLLDDLIVIHRFWLFSISVCIQVFIF